MAARLEFDCALPQPDRQRSRFSRESLPGVLAAFHIRGMTQAQAEQTVRDLVDRYGGDAFRMSEADLTRLEAAITVLGQERVFRVAQDQMHRRA